MLYYIFLTQMECVGPQICLVAQQIDHKFYNKGGWEGGLQGGGGGGELTMVNWLR